MEAPPPGGSRPESVVYPPKGCGGCGAARLATTPGDSANEWIRGTARPGPARLCTHRCNNPATEDLCGEGMGGHNWSLSSRVYEAKRWRKQHLPVLVAGNGFSQTWKIGSASSSCLVVLMCCFAAAKKKSPKVSLNSILQYFFSLLCIKIQVLQQHDDDKSKRILRSNRRFHRFFFFYSLSSISDSRLPKAQRRCSFSKRL